MNKDKEDKAISELIEEEEENESNLSLDEDRALNFDKRGKFVKGNKMGKLPREKVYSTSELVQAIREVEEEGDEKGNKIDVLKHYVRQSLKDNRVMIDLIGKKIPKITINQLENKSGIPFNLFVMKFLEEEEKDINERPES